jgi:GNAT superfamily N-acetyltransferase
MHELNIREAEINDKESLALLCNQLGYEAKTEDIPPRLDQIKELSHQIVYVAVIDQQVVGWIHVYLCPLLISGLQAQLGGMVVDEKFRNKGIGKKLLIQAENWARSKSCHYISIFTNITRSETHHFYAQMDYQTKKTEYVLQKEL